MINVWNYHNAAKIKSFPAAFPKKDINCLCFHRNLIYAAGTSKTITYFNDFESRKAFKSYHKSHASDISSIGNFFCLDKNNKEF